MPSHWKFINQVAPPPLPPVLRDSKAKVSKDQKLLVAGVAASGGITAAIAFLVVLLLLYRRFRAVGKIQKTNPSEGSNSANLKSFSYRDLKAATKSFSDVQKLGQGGFGAVYRGRLQNSGEEIAVKVLDAMSLQGEREFQNEVSVIGKVSSPHIVGLLGFCADRKRGRRLLVYEYMQNRSLQDALFEEGYGVQLGWKERFRIVLDSAKALAFLHSKCEPAIIHGDIKPSNILLDANFSARIADFGLARFKMDVSGAEAELQEEMEQKWRRKERRNGKKVRDFQSLKIENDEAVKVNADGDFKISEEKVSKADVDGDLMVIEEGDSKANSDGDSKAVADTDSKAVEDRDIKADLDRDRDLKADADGDSKAFADGDLKVKGEDLKDKGEDLKTNIDGDLGFQSPETFVSNSPTEENVIFMSSNAASPEGLHYDTETVTDTQEERTPSEIVDLEKNTRGRDRTLDCKSVDFSRDEDDKMSLSECFEKASLDSGRPGSSHNPGRRKKGKEWWRWQDNSGEFSVKEYVMEWIGTEIKKEKPKSSWRTEDEIQRDSNMGSLSSSTKKKHKRKESLEWWASLAEENKDIIKQKQKSKTRGKEWWREEYCEELSNKGRKSRTRSGGEWWKNEKEQETKKQWWRSKSVSRDWWSGENNTNSNHLYNSGDCASGISSTPSTRGTVCYIAPECGGGGVVSEKSDVYSFGVVMLVIISGRRPLQVMASPITELERANLISWVRHLARAGKVLELVDVALGGDYDKDQALLCINVALLCLQRLPASRPSMCDVVKFLSGVVDPPPLPVEFSPSPPYGIPFRSRRKSSRPHLHTNGHRCDRNTTTLTQ